MELIGKGMVLAVSTYPRMFLFERVAAALPKTLFDMGVSMADVRP